LTFTDITYTFLRYAGASINKKDGIKDMLLRQLKSWTAALGLAAAIWLTAMPASADSWVPLKFPLKEVVTGMSFISPDTGFIVSAGAKYGKTTDGGKNWVFYTLRKTDSSFEDICFINKDTGMICGRYGRLYRTVNACKSWEYVWLPGNDLTPWLTSIVLMHGGPGVMVGLKPGQPPNGVAYRTEDAGNTWKALDVKGLAFGELYYRAGDPICFQSWGRLNYSIDKGLTWGSMAIPTKTPTRATSFFGKAGIVCGNNGALAYTTNRGQIWTSVFQGSDVNFTAALMVNDSIGYVCGTKGTILKTTDGGKTWDAETEVDKVDYAGLYQSGKNVYAYGADGVILRTTVK
jgi:photosystem II stability/assembly factor-like uncharacterized protein